MSEKSCKICKSIKRNGVRLYNAPKEEHRREKWSAACGVTITKTSVFCEKHFSQKDFYGRKQNLKVDALPTENIIETAEDRTLEAMRPQVKTEPPEFVIVTSNALSLNEEPRIKEEPIDDFQPLEFIDENCFDEHTDNPIGTNEDGNTSLNTFGNKLLTCGRIVMEIEKSNNHSYKLACSYCKLAIPTTEKNFWQQFITHLTTTHETKIQPFEECQNTFSCTLNPEVQEKEPTIAIEENVKEVVEATTENTERNDLKFVEKVSKDSDTDSDVAGDTIDQSYAESSSDFNDSCDETYEPKSKKSRKTNNTSSQSTESGKKVEDIISFDHPKNCVIAFLELLKENSILWLQRQSIMKLFDQALTDVSEKFNKRFPNYSISKDQLRQSINRIKKLYYQSSEEKHKRRTKNSMYKIKYPEYFELCSAIEENSKNIKQNCDLCHCVFYTPIDMQIHKVKRHHIGELPFKCQRCGYGFTCPKKLESHEQKHNRVKTFICEFCNHGFYLESKLQAHLALHTDDSKQICEICGKKFPSLSKYRRHKLHHEAPKEKCQICGKLYFEKWTLSEHMKSHLNERLYKCDICGKKFNRREGVTIHKRGVHKIKTQTKRYVWVNRVTNTSNNEMTSQNRDSIENEAQNSNSNSSTLSSTMNEETRCEMKPVISGNPSHAMFPLEILNSLLN